MRALLTALMLTGSVLAAPLTITPPSQEVQPGSLVILTASELSNWSTTAGTLGSVQGTRIVLEAPMTPGPVTVTITDPKDATRKAFGVVTVKAPLQTVVTWKPSTIAAGLQFSAAVGTDGRLWVWGSNEQRVLLGSSAKTSPTPMQIDNITGVQAVAASPTSKLESGSAIAVVAEGTAWLWGGKTINPVSQSSQAQAVNLRGCGSILQSDHTVLGDFEKFTLKNVVHLTANSDRTSSVSAAIDRTGNLFVSRGQCSSDFKQVTGLRDVVAAEALDLGLVLAATADGRGFLVKNLQSKPLVGFTDIQRLTTAGRLGFFVKKNGTLFQFTLDKSGNPSVPAQVKGLSDIVDVSMSGGHTLALRRDGTLFAMGNNQYGQLGNGTTQNSSTFVQVVGLKVKVP